MAFSPSAGENSLSDRLTEKNRGILICLASCNIYYGPLRVPSGLLRLNQLVGTYPHENRDNLCSQKNNEPPVITWAPPDWSPGEK